MARHSPYGWASVQARVPYDTLRDKDRAGVIAELEQLVGAARITLAQGSEWLISQRAPRGPIMGERSVSHVYKCVWAMYAAASDRSYLTQMLDWLQREALRPSGDFFFPEEAAVHRDDIRSYRALTFLRFAALVDHPLAREPRVLTRIRQYQEPLVGGCYHYIGEDPSQPVWPGFLNTGETSFFGEFALAAGLREEALKAGAWAVRLVEDNRSHVAEEGVFYLCTNREGRLITEVGPGERFIKSVNNWDANQAGWNIGCLMAFLADLYDCARERWGYGAQEVEKYLQAALELAAFEDTMPLYTYYWPSKCKVSWGAGTLLRVLVKYGLGSEEQIDQVYRAGKRVFVYTFLGTQLPDGSWPPVYYPHGDDSPELSYDYRVLKGLILTPTGRTASTDTSTYLPAVEITGEFLGEIAALTEGLNSLLQSVRAKG